MTQEYFDWMCHLVCDGREGGRRRSRRKLLGYLHHREFTWTLEMDENRAEDGTDLRYRFAYEQGYTRNEIAATLDIQPCSVLEMMVALAIRCEEHIMDDPDIGNRTAKWFWEMVNNLGLGDMDDEHFNEAKAAAIVTRFLERTYKPTGEGGLFCTTRFHRDLRDIEIWYQMQWHLDEYLDD